jgi:hypothetical protein
MGTLNQTLQDFVHVLRDPSARQAAPTSSLGPHSSLVNLQLRFEPPTKNVVSQERLAGFVPGEEKFCSPGSGGRDQGAVEGGVQTLGDCQAPWEDVRVADNAEGLLPDFSEREAQDGDGEDGSKAGRASSLRTEVNAVESEIVRGSEGQQSRDEQNNKTKLRTNSRRGGAWDHRRRSSFGEGLLGRNPREENPPFPWGPLSGAILRIRHLP